MSWVYIFKVLKYNSNLSYRNKAVTTKQELGVAEDL